MTVVAHGKGANADYKGLAQAQASDGKTYLSATHLRSGRERSQEQLQAGRAARRLVRGPPASRRSRAIDIADSAGKLYATYAKQDAGREDDAAGPGHGFVDVFTNDGALIRRWLPGPRWNSPWGLALAPDNFGRFSGALLVGNFGDGHNNAYNPDTGAHLGQLRGANRHPIAIEGLVELAFRQRERRQDQRADLLFRAR